MSRQLSYSTTRASNAAIKAAKRAAAEQQTFSKTFRDVFIVTNDVTSAHIANAIAKSGHNGGPSNNSASGEVRIHNILNKMTACHCVVVALHATKITDYAVVCLFHLWHGVDGRLLVGDRKSLLLPVYQLTSFQRKFQ